MSCSEQLLALFRRCTARISDPQYPERRGTGFFVAPGLLLTCAHVVKSSRERAGSVTVEWEGRTYTAFVEQCLDEKYPDLALLKIEHFVAHPCVRLHEGVDLNDDLYSYGYTDNYRDGDSSTFKSEGWTDGQKLLLKLKDGEVRHGLSGAPILNLRTGGVCALVKMTRGVETSMGGRAIPTRAIFLQFPQLVALQQEFHERDKTWLANLSPQQAQLLNQSASSSSIEIFYLYADVDEDKRLLDRLEKHLAIMQRQGTISTWNKSKVEPGADEQREIERHLGQAQIILFMVSSDFLVAHYLDGSGVERALDRRSDGVIVIPVLLRRSDWKESPFGTLQPLPPNGLPVAAWSDKDDALFQVAKGLRGVVNRLRTVHQ